MTKKPQTESAKQTGKQGGKLTPFAGGDVILIAGLGNPGSQYAGHRHNIGFMALDRAAADHGFGTWRSKFQGEIAEGRLSGKRVVLLKPMTFMNESGRAVGEAARFLKIDAADVIVIHDELDLAPGKCRVKSGGGHAGHNGLRSIHAHIGAEYARVRLGIGHPGRKELVSGYVLHDFARADQDWLDDLMRGVSDGLPKLIEGDAAGFQNAVALRTQPQRPTSGAKAPHQAKVAAKKPAEAAKKVEKILSASKPDNPLARLLAKFNRG
ncbi:MAG: aminoacyl-tRNA hydrolase [Pseudomonadota bacterium]